MVTDKQFIVATQHNQMDNHTMKWLAAWPVHALQIVHGFQSQDLTSAVPNYLQSNCMVVFEQSFYSIV